MSEDRQSNESGSISPEILASFSRPTDLDMAPDGSKIAYVVAPISKDVDKDTEHGVSTIWVVGTLDGEPRQFTGGTWEDADPRWSPDGSQLAFLSDRAERRERSVYVMPTDGGEGVRIFDKQGTISNLDWSPDGRYLSFLYTDPETDEEKEKKESKDDARVWDTDRKWRRLWLIDRQDGNSASTVSPENRQVWSYSWSQDGSRIALNTSPNPRINDIFLETQVDLVSPTDHETHRLFNLTGTTGNMVWSNDGTRIGYVGTSGQVVNGEHLFVIEVDGGGPANLTPDLRGTIENIVPLNGGEALAGTIGYGVNDAYRRIDWDGTITPISGAEVPRGTFTSAPAANADGSLVAGIWEDGANLPDIWVIDTGTGELHRRTRLNAEIEVCELGGQQIVEWESDEGVTVEGVLITPPGYDHTKTYPLVVQVHGGPTGRWTNGWYGNWHDWGQLLASNGFAVLMHNPRGSTGYGSDYMNALVDGIGQVELRDLMSGVDAMIERGIADPERLGLGGWSWGGYMTAWTVTQTDRFKAAVMGAGLPNMVSDNSIGDIPSANLSYFTESMFENPEPFWERSAIRHIRNCTTPVMILHGEADDRVNMYQSVEMYVALRELGLEHEFVTYPREPHGIRERKHQIDLMNRVVRWFSDRLGA
ncbi:MAG: S9 family peptidase [Thermomicrobiales bacterium]